MSATVVIDDEGFKHDLRYQVRVLRDTYVVDGEPDEIQYHAGEVIVLDAFDTVSALSQGWGAYVGVIIDFIRSVPVDV